MRKSYLLLGCSLTLPLLASCGSGDGFSPSNPGAPDKVYITATNAGIAAGETNAIIDVVGLIGNADERLLSVDVDDVTLPCTWAGYGGGGTIIVQGRLQQPGDTMRITFNGCTLADAPLVGAVKATLMEYHQGDENERYVTRYLYQDFTMGEGANSVAIEGNLVVESDYDYLTETSTTIRRSDSLQLARGQMRATVNDLECTDAYTGLWDSAPFTMECQLRFESAMLGGTLSVTTTEPFKGVGGENRPSSGELLIRGANSKARFIAQQDGEHVLIQWDQDNDDYYEGQLLRTWEELKRDILDWNSLLTP